MHIRPIKTLPLPEVADLGRFAAERGERIKDANPFPRGTPRRAQFSRAYARRALELRLVAAAS
ncbi:hypothetical protein H4CHR_04420 [Variovorax sp. PBS-H4]|uniref:hypothetical protein n=1 Tax=Variovorax sp. PBS-H4 TaxID=434008 RepID=UPI0013165673|nr:hypothetical protein [Variovorax sp. PBS-H4]VTU38419.1 hypothetical protein H4CHR_04420 [Variovorax sp. PBS-H4]